MLGSVAKQHRPSGKYCFHSGLGWALQLLRKYYIFLFNLVLIFRVLTLRQTKITLFLGESIASLLQGSVRLQFSTFSKLNFESTLLDTWLHSSITLPVYFLWDLQDNLQADSLGAQLYSQLCGKQMKSVRKCRGRGREVTSGFSGDIPVAIASLYRSKRVACAKNKDTGAWSAQWRGHREWEVT